MAAVVELDDEEKYLLAILDGTDGIDIAEFCVKEGTLVLTSRGHVPIEEVRLGEQVLTHRGRWRTVTAVLDRGVRDVVTLKGAGLSGLTMTADHRLYARRARQGLRSIEGHRNVFLMDPDWLEAGDAEFGGSGRVRNTRYATPMSVESLGRSCTPEQGWLLGRWLADGSKHYSSRAGYAVSWAIRDRDLAEFRVRVKAAGFDRLTVTATQSAQCWNAVVYQQEFYRWLPAGRAENKAIPTWVLGASDDVRRAVLEGYLSGDGHWSGSNWQASTVSRALAHDLRVLAATLGWSVSVSVTSGGEQSKFGTTVTAQQLWSLTMTDDGGWAEHDGLHQWSMLKSRTAAGQAHVWDLSVEDDHSFVAGGVVVHNCWIDEEQDTRTFRAWDFQWPWYTTEDTLQIDQAGRSLGKSTGIQMRAFAFPFNYAGAEMLITAPELNHLRPLTDAVEGRILASRMAREMLPKRKGNGLARQPHWQATFANGARIISRLPNKDGRGVKGMHPTVLEGDEMQDFPLAGWIELVETHKRGSTGSQVRFHGVSRGVRDKYWELTQPDSDFRVHRYMANHRPSWTAEERQEKIKLYQSRQSVDYRRNIYGEHGDASNPVFVLAKLMACVDTDEGSTYNTEVYTIVRVDFEQTQGGREIVSFLDLPGTHLHGYSQFVTPDLDNGKHGAPRQVGSPKGYSAYFAGMDVGVTNHPSEILVFGQRKESDLVELLLRVHMRRIGTEDQMEMVEAIFNYYGSKLKAFALDKTGVGQPIWDMLSRKPYIGDRIYGYNYSEKVVTGFEDRPLAPTETQADLAMMRNVVEHSTDVLRNDMVDVGRIRLPFDRELLSEWQGQNYTVVKSDGSPYGKRNYSAGTFHTLDAGKMMAAGKTLPPIEAMLENTVVQPPVYDLFLGAF